MQFILSIFLSLSFLLSCNQPFLYDPKPKAKVNPIVGILGAGAALLADLEPDQASCLDAETLTLSSGQASSSGFVVKTEAYKAKQVRFYKFESNKSLWITVSLSMKNSCMIVGKENQFVSTNYRLSDVEDIPNSCASSITYSFLINAGQFRCIGAIATEPGNGSLSIYESSNNKPFTYSSISPSSGPVGTLVTIRGENFTTYGNNLTFPTDFFSYQFSKIEYMDFYTIKARVPLNARTGAFQMNYQSTGMNFTVTPPTLPTWSQENCTYNQITGTEVSMISNDHGYTSVPLGFNFFMSGVQFDSVYVSTDGRVDFFCPNCITTTNTLQDTSSSGTFATTTSFSYSLAPWFFDSEKLSDSSISYAVQGSAGARTFIIQYSNYPENRLASPVRLNYQVRLKEGTNVIEFHYGTKSGAGSITSNTIAGIRIGNGGAGNIRNALDGSTTANSYLSTQSGFGALTGKCVRFTP